jgi:hypothetical protein
MKELIIAFTMLFSPLNNINEPKTCYCSDSKLGTWTAYCVQQNWSCKKCCEYSKSYLKKNKDE